MSMHIPFAIETGGCYELGPTWVYRWSGEEFELEFIEPPTDQELEAAPICADALEAGHSPTSRPMASRRPPIS